MNAVRAVIFDISGTVLDHGSRGPVAAFVELFARRGVAVTREAARKPMGAHKRDHIAAMLSDPEVIASWVAVCGGTPRQSDLDSLYEEFTPLQIEVLERHCDVIEGVPAVVEDLRGRGMRIANTTGFTSQMISAGLRRRAAEGGYVPDLWVTPDLVGAGRPAPWMALYAARELNVYPISAIVKVGDTVVDIEEAHNAGMWSVAVTRTGNEVGVSREKWGAMTAEDQRARLEQARARLAVARPHYFIESVAELAPVVEEISARIGRGERP